MKKVKEKGKAESNNIKLSVRMRPLLFDFQDEVAWRVQSSSNSLQSLQNQAQVPPGSESNMMIKRRYADAYYNYKFSFDNVFGPEDSTENVYKGCCRSLIKSIFQGFNCTIFMYGQTTSGKTYTMMGNSENPGILPYSLHDIYNQVSTLKDQGYKFQIEVSYLEIYNQQINDLLNPGSLNLKIHQDSDKLIVVQGLKQCKADNFNKAIFLMRFGQQQRCYKEKHIHDHSSRSHTIFQLKLMAQCEQEGSFYKFSSLLNMVDLAGSERIQDEEPRSQNYDETGYINKSLFILSNVINKLAQGKKNAHIPYRDSKLTRFLSNSLGGNSKTAIICTASPAAMNFYQTLSTLRFASRAKKISNKPRANEQKTPTFELNDLKEELLSKSNQIEELKAQIVRLNLNVSRPAQQPNRSQDQESETSFMSRLYQRFLQRIKTDHFSAKQVEKWESKAMSLVGQYHENIKILQDKYRMAMVNLTERQMEIDSDHSQIQKLIEAGLLFNDIKVSQILSPEFPLPEPLDPWQFRKDLRLAFESAKDNLMSEWDQIRDNKGLRKEMLSKARGLFESKLKVLSTAYRDVADNLPKAL